MRNFAFITFPYSGVLYRASVVRQSDTWGEVDEYWRWTIPTFFRDVDSAILAGAKSAARRKARYGGEWKIEIDSERVSIA